MSGFFKGIFGGSEEELQQEAQMVPTEELESHKLSEEDMMEPLEADVRGTIDTDMPDSEQTLSRKAEMDENPDLGIWARRPVDPVEHREFTSEGVWNAYEVSTRDQETVEKAQHLLGSLPESTPNAVKRQIVEASLKAFEVSIDEIIAGASDEITSLRRYIEKETETAESFTMDGETRIATLEAEIADIRATISDAKDQRERLVGAANEVIEHVQPVLDFFSPSETTAAPPSTLPSAGLPSPNTFTEEVMTTTEMISQDIETE